MNLKTKLSIKSWNVQGIFYRNNNERFSKLNDTEFVNQIKSDIVCLLETKAEKGDNLTMKGYTLLKQEESHRKVSHGQNMLPMLSSHSYYLIRSNDQYKIFYPSLGIPLSLRLMRQPMVSLLFIKLLIYL